MKTKNIYIDPVWNKYRCDHGKQWTAVKGGMNATKDGSECFASGCPRGHFVHIVGETKNREEAHNWFKGFN